MKSIFFFILAVLFLSSCRLFHKNRSDKDLKTVKLHGTVHKPYCGGAKPTDEVAAGYYESMKSEKFNIVQGTEYKQGMKIYQEFTFDESGNIDLLLEKGDYMIIRADKFLPLEEFMSMNGPYEEKNYRVKESDCFKKWQNTVDLHFKVVNDTVIEMRQKAKCWVGTNPCLEYTGPPAP